jgi:hypothetical protein
MNRFLTNRTTKKGVLGFFVLLVFLMPVSLSLTTLGNRETAGVHLSIDRNIVSAASAIETTAAKALGASDFFMNPMGVIGYSFMQFASVFTGFGGMLLDKSIEETVFKMGSKVTKPAPLGATLDTIWSLIRDICNLVFIFGFIYVGIRTIIDPESASTKRFLSRIIIGALLINFSLFFAKAIIDFANFSAVQIYTQMTVGAGSISESVANQLGVITFFGTSPGALVDGIPFSFYIMAGIFLFVTAFTFLAASLLLIVRFVALILLMIASPILFAATVFPQTEHLASDLWKKLISYAFFAPAYLLLLIICLKMVRGLKIGITETGFAEVFLTTNASTTAMNLNIVLNFVIIIFFMIAALTIASKMGIAGGKLAVSVGNMARGKAQSIIGRNTVGLASHLLKKGYDKFDAKVSKESWGTKRGFALKTIRAGVAGIAGGDKGLRNVLEKGEKATFGGSDSYKSVKDYNKERKGRQAAINELDKFKSEVGKGVAPDGSLVTFTKDAEGTAEEKQIKLERAIANATLKDFEELKQEQRKAIVGLMTDSQVEAFQKSDKLTDTEKHDLAETRQAHIEKMYSDGNVTKLSKAGVGHLTALGYKYLSQDDHAIRLTSSQMDDLKKKLTPTEFNSLAKRRDDTFESLAGGGEVDSYDETGAPVKLNHEFITKMKPKEVASLATKVLVTLADKGTIPVSALEAMKKDGSKSKPDESAIKKAIEDAGKRGVDISAHKKFFKSPLGNNFGS